MDIFSQLLQQEYKKGTKIKVPQRGENVRLIELAQKNAHEEAERLTNKEEKRHATLILLSKMIGVEYPLRIESFDISNISGTDTVASMVVFEEGKAKKKDYRHFQIDNLPTQDDYAAMMQAVSRRIRRFQSGDPGFAPLPNLLLIDGGTAHAKAAQSVLTSLNIALPVFGMVKDDRHRTRALVTPQGEEIAIDVQQTVFSLIGSIQEETHRFAIDYHRKLRSKRLNYSELDAIKSIGPKRKALLLKVFKSISRIKSASINELERHLPQDAARAVFDHFHSNKGERK